jgi:hypothetical protein
MCERAWATDAVARLTCVRRTRLSARSVNTLSRPRLSLATNARSRASDASDAVGANMMNSNGRDTWQPLVPSDASVAFVGRATALLSEPPL